MDLKKLIGKRVKELRKQSGLKQEELASAVNIDAKSISRIETGVFLPSLDLILRMSRIFNIAFNEMFLIEHLKPQSDIINESNEILSSLSEDKLKLAYKLLLTVKKD